MASTGPTDPLQKNEVVVLPVARIAAAVAFLLAPLPELAQAETPAKGSPLRAAILDGLRPAVEAEVGAPVEFVVNEMRVIGEWAFVMVAPQRPGGGAIAYAYTRYQSAFDAGAFDNQVTALLRDTPSGWLVYEYNLGATDAIWVDWPGRYPAPHEIFPMN